MCGAELSTAARHDQVTASRTVAIPAAVYERTSLVRALCVVIRLFALHTGHDGDGAASRRR
jgi:hypothetical protein